MLYLFFIIVFSGLSFVFGYQVGNDHGKQELIEELKLSSRAFLVSDDFMIIQILVTMLSAVALNLTLIMTCIL